MERSCARAVELGLPSIAFTEHVDLTRWYATPEDQTAMLRGDFGPVAQRFAGWIDAENYYAMPPLDVDGYRSALSQWLQRRADWPAMREAAHRAGEPYTLDRMIRELEALYQRLLPR